MDKLNVHAKNVRGLYGVDTDFVFAVGDGNHSLATAQAHWKNVRKTLSNKERECHPARYALVEIENLHCDGIVFEPIHRFVFGVDDADFVLYMSTALKGESRLKMFTTNMEYTIAVNSNSAEAIAEVQDAIRRLHFFPSRRQRRLHPRARESAPHRGHVRRRRRRDALHREDGALRICRRARQPLQKGVLHGRGGREEILFRGKEDQITSSRRRLRGTGVRGEDIFLQQRVL